MRVDDLQLARLQLSHAQLLSNLAGERQLREAAETRVRALSREMESIARLYVPQELEQRSRTGQALDPLGIAQLVQTAGAQRLWSLEAAANGRAAQPALAGGPGNAVELQQQLIQAQAQAREQQQRADTAEANLAALREAAAAAQQKVAALQRRLDQAEAALAQRELAQARSPQAARPLPEVEEPPAAGRPEGRDVGRGRDLVRVLAFQGLARWPAVSQILAGEWGVQPDSSTLGRVLRKAAEDRLVEVQSVSNETGRGGPVNLVQLTEVGCQQAREWFGQEPVAQELDQLLKRHKSPEHALLNLQAADVFREAGYIVDLFPAPRTVDGGTFAPDLLLAESSTGEVVYVECERETRKDLLARDRKWQLVAAGTGGQVNIVTANRKAMDALVSEVTAWAIQGGYQATLQAGNLMDMQPDRLWKVCRPLGRR